MQTTKKKHTKTIGFGCPDTVGPHKFVVHIPRATKKEVTIVEDFGVSAADDGQSEIERCVLDRSKWSEIAQEVKKVFNQRLRSQNLTTSRWKIGDNYVDRLLGKELLVLAWSVETVEVEQIRTAVANWIALRPEERWWLYGMTATSAGGSEHVGQGWRMALRYGLAETQNEKVLETRKKIPESEKKSQKKKTPNNRSSCRL